jgi:glycosyltransferase involved in cell wall biosynthesis
MDVSLIIATRDRSHQLARCLDSVARIEFDRTWELIVVDNGSNDATADVVKQFAGEASLPLRYVLEPKPGLGNAHNAGVAVAHGQILAFTDDDCYPETDFLKRIWCAFADPSIGYIAGRITLHDPADYPITTIESTTPYTFLPRRLVTTGSFGGANMAFRRKVLLEIGGFDPLFGPGALFNAEDVDAAARASALGWKGEYRPDVIVRHHHRRKASDAPRLLKSYAIGAGAYHMKLLLSGHEFSWFVRSVYHAVQRYEYSRSMILWESVGGLKYACVYLLQALRG